MQCAYPVPDYSGSQYTHPCPFQATGMAIRGEGVGRVVLVCGHHKKCLDRLRAVEIIKEKK